MLHVFRNIMYYFTYMIHEMYISGRVHEYVILKVKRLLRTTSNYGCSKGVNGIIPSVALLS